MMTKKTVLLTGATGMVGGQVLDILLASPAVGNVISIGRRKTAIQHEKLHEIVHADFRDFTAVSSELVGVDVCFYCLGVYQGQVSKETYFEITCDYQQALTDALARVSPQATFVLFGASGADPSEQSRTLFALAKGRAENLLHEAGFPRRYIFRPGYIHPTGARRPTGLSYRLLLPIAGTLLKYFPGLALTDRDLARAMVSVGIEAAQDSAVFSNRMIKKIAASTA